MMAPSPKSAITLADLRRLMDWWAHCHVTANGYPAHSAICTDGGVSTRPQSRPPANVELPGAVRAVQRGMDSAITAGYGNQIAVLRAWHLRSRNSNFSDLAESLGLSEKSVRTRRGIAEGYLMGYLARDEVANDTEKWY